MCTLTYLPKSGLDFIFTSNRDEHITRSALPPSRYRIHGQSVLYPKDPIADGTWIATNGNFTVCLLNGAFEKHHHRPPYRLSRGIVLLDFFRYRDVPRYITEYEFGDIEPFTILILGSGNTLNLDEIRWDGKKITHTPKPTDIPQIWSSATLYSPEVVKLREEWFMQWIGNHPDMMLEDILKFHHFEGSGHAENDIFMKRSDVLRTISVTSVFNHKGVISMSHEDLLSGTTSQCHCC